ncbi:hypothetical protein B5F83_02635 [Muribaculum sp. An289]|nr:hypothetical protein B5F83_02635 [Muribaculum sp. An289]
MLHKIDDSIDNVNITERFMALIFKLIVFLIYRQQNYLMKVSWENKKFNNAEKSALIINKIEKFSNRKRRKV